MISRRREEWHVTVVGDVLEWPGVCANLNIKPLYIELSTGLRQLMCASHYDVAPVIEREAPHFRVVRNKHEVSALNPDEEALYWEVHYKIDGDWLSAGPLRQPQLPGRIGASRDLYRWNRSYVTRRQQVPFTQRFMHDWIITLLNDSPRKLRGWEVEACLEDTNMLLDSGWL